MFVLLTAVSIGLDEVAWRAAGEWAYWIVFTIGTIFLSVLGVNMAGEYLKVFMRERASVRALFTGLKVNFFRKLGGMLWMTLWVAIWASPWVIVLSYLFAGFTEGLIDGNAFAGSVFLTLPLLTPAIIKGLSYYMMTYILASASEVKALESMRLSKRMTKGHKGKLFPLFLCFFGWTLLTILPAGFLSDLGAGLVESGSAAIGILLIVLGYLLSGLVFILFLGPYMYTSLAGFFLELRDNAIETGKITPEEFGIEVEDDFSFEAEA